MRPKAKKKAVKKKRTTAATDDKKRVLAMTDALKREYPDARCQLDFTSAFELLIATILAAQCTDVMVNRVTKVLFAKYKTPRDYVDAPQEALEEDIRQTGFFRNKAKSIKKCCAALIDDHNGEVPSTMEELTALGGVGRKTANCVLGNAFGIPGLVVDTHVLRLSRRMGYTEEKNPDKVERALCAIVPEAEWTPFSHLLGDHGRAFCSARKPMCEECPVEHLCPKILDLT